jgi:transposase-like protein
MIRVVSTAIAVLLLTLPMTGFGQQGSDEVAAGRAMVQAGREELIRSELRFTAAEAAAFWPIYERYQAASSAIGDRYAALLTEYVDRYNSGDLSDEYAVRLLDDYFGIKQEMIDVQTKFLPKFREVLPALKVAQFFQLENKIRAEIDSQLAIAIPLIDPT